jgi:hypothetical protein
MQEQNPCRMSTVHKPEGTRRVGRTPIRWLDSAEEDLETIGVRNLRRSHRIAGSLRSNRKIGPGSSWTARRRQNICVFPSFFSFNLLPKLAWDKCLTFPRCQNPRHSYTVNNTNDEAPHCPFHPSIFSSSVTETVS